MNTIDTPEITAALLVNLAGIILSLISTYVPGWREKFAAWTSEKKSLFMLIVMAAVTVVIGLLSWSGIWVLIPATKEGLLFLFITFGTAMVTNQATYTISPQPKKVKEIKASR